MREAKRAALFVPTIFEGIAQPARADASHASGQRCKSFCPHHLLSLWCSPANMPASHAGDHRSEAGQGRHFLGAWFTGNSRPTWLEPGSLDVQVVSPTNSVKVHSFCPPHLLSLWCSPANMPASHAGDHRSEAGQGRQFLGAWFTGNSRPTWLRTRQPWTCKSSRADQFQRPQSILSDALAR